VASHNLNRMGDEDLTPAWPEVLKKIRARTPARIFVGRGAAYNTRMSLDLRGAHADAVDAVWSEFELHRDLPAEVVAQWKLFQVSSQAESKAQFLLRPDLGRKFSSAAREQIDKQCAKTPDLQIVIGDGLSLAAVTSQVPALLPLLHQNATERGWKI